MCLDIPVLGGDGICSIGTPQLADASLDGRRFCAQGGSALSTLQRRPEFGSRYEKQFGVNNEFIPSLFLYEDGSGTGNEGGELDGF
ncbi:hypothetical protein BN2475_810002 [Paraburkholderia ribeironis]|uniref:Uncharacterized protein n=1 Tax=Paraburkholderia ribeironis TaxID=1247936 RepID=A0A1N7SK23_9BURK|nr:hypothetical protein BN2475_810002 [Paraburkholderia ribeironis]